MIFFSLQAQLIRRGRVNSNFLVALFAKLFFSYRALFTCVSKLELIGFALLGTRLALKLAPFFHPIRKEIKTNRDSQAHFFTRFVIA